MSAQATGFVWANSPFTGAQLLVHLAIADVVNDMHDNEFWMSTTALAKKARVARSTVIESLSEMCKQRLLIKVSAGKDERRPSRYRFLFEYDTSSGPLDRSGDMTRPVSGQVTKENPIEPKGVARPENGHVDPSWSNATRGAIPFVERCKGCDKLTIGCECGTRDDNAAPPWKLAGLTYQEWRESERVKTEGTATDGVSATGARRGTHPMDWMHE